MVLAIAAGFGVRALLGWSDPTWHAAPWIGAFVGLLAAQFVPARTACSVKPPTAGPEREPAAERGGER